MDAEGKFRTFETGAVRDTANKKPMLQLISPHLPFRLGEWLRFACQDRKPEPYPPRNWEKGMPFSETIGSMERHMQKRKLGPPYEEDHLAAIAFGAMALMHYEAEIVAGHLPASLDDMPVYNKQKPDEPEDTVILDDYELPVDHPVRKTASEVDCIAHFLGMSDSLRQLYCQKPGMKVLPAGLESSAASETALAVRKTFYLTGPMRGLPMLNWPAFDEAQARGEAMGFHIISPAEEDRKRGIDPTAQAKISSELVDEVFLEDIQFVMGLKRERGDGLALLPDWGASVGVGLEVSLARLRGLQVVSARDFRPLLQSELLSQLLTWVGEMRKYLMGEK